MVPNPLFSDGTGTVSNEELPVSAGADGTGVRKLHPELSLRLPDSLDRGPHRIANRNVISRHFKMLKTVLEENNLLEKLQN